MSGVPKKDRALLSAVSAVVMDLDESKLAQTITLWENVPSSEASLFCKQLRLLREAQAALLKSKKQPVELTVEGEYWEKGEHNSGGDFYYMYVGDTALCELVDKTVKCNWDKGYSSYGRVKIHFTFYEAEARNA